MVEMMDGYMQFLAGKAPRVHACGLADVPALHPRLFDFQAACTEFALRQGRCGMFLDTGLGKTAIQLVFLQHAAAATNGRSLLLAPLAVGWQIVREANVFGIEARQIREQSEAAAGINVCNYDRLDRIDVDEFGAVSLDECFARGTEIDTPTGKKHIENLRRGDQILNCTGVDMVSDVHRREVAYAVMVKIASASFVASPNHPIFTQRGWVGAQHLRAGDRALATGAAVRLVRGDLRPEVSVAICAEVLRDVLLSEMENDAEGRVGQGPFARGRSETRGEEARMACVGAAGGTGRIGEDYETQPIDTAGCAGEDFCHVEGHEARTVRAWGQWTWADIAASLDAGCAWDRMGSGVSVITGPKEARIPNMLQDRLRQSAVDGRNRGGWCVTFGREEGIGSEAGCDDCFVRVDGIEILEQGDHRLDQLRDADGKLYFYDIGATRHPSYSVAGLLVHNSSILKSFTGKTSRALINAFAGHRFRMAATATPAPNDHMELGQHAEFLGAMSATEMLMRYFVNDASTASQKWRLKGHARGEFWSWMASWSRMASSPADLGFDGSRFVLPPLNVIRHRVACGSVTNKDDGTLFGGGISATAMFDIKRQTTAARAEAAAAIVNGSAVPWVVWCDTDAESKAITAAIDGAIEVKGSQPAEVKEERLAAFADGSARVIVTKPSVAGFGLNWQHCHNVVFAGRTFSYEAWYQAVRRCWRFGQQHAVNVHLLLAIGEDEIGRVIDRKAGDHDDMKTEMAHAMRQAVTVAQVKAPYLPTHEGRMPKWLSV